MTSLEDEDNDKLADCADDDQTPRYANTRRMHRPVDLQGIFHLKTHKNDQCICYVMNDKNSCTVTERIVGRIREIEPA